VEGGHINSFLADLRQNPVFLSFLDSRVLPNMPPAMPWQAETTLAQLAHNTGLQEGYLLALQQFGVNLNDYRADRGRLG
jgi:hypothetical protein